MTPQLSEKIKITSFVSIFMVVFLHAYNLDTKQNGVVLVFEKSYNWFVQDFISMGLTRVAVPIFFIISSYLFFKGKPLTFDVYLEKIKKRIHSLLIPFLFWSVFGILVYFVLQTIPFLRPFFSKDLVVNFTPMQWVHTVFVMPIPYQLWFIRDLMLLVLVSPIINWLLVKFRLIPICLIAVFWVLDFGDFNNSIEALLFFSLGGYLGMFGTEIATKDISKSTHKFFMAWIVLLLIKTTVLFFNADAYVARILLKLAILIGIIALWGEMDFFQKHPSSRFLQRHIDKTFFVFAFHEPLLTILKKGLFFLIGKEEWSYFAIYFTAPLLTILISILIAVFVKRNLQAVYFTITGGR